MLDALSWPRGQAGIESSSLYGETVTSAKIIWMSSSDIFEPRWIAPVCHGCCTQNGELDTAFGKDPIEEPDNSSSTHCLVLSESRDHRRDIRGRKLVRDESEHVPRSRSRS